MKFTATVLTNAALLFTAAIAQADPATIPISPGLWEVTSRTTSADPKVAEQMQQAQEAMKNMPPEQRRMMEGLMRQQGVSMSTSGDGAIVATMCINDEMLKQGQLGAHQGSCEHSVTEAKKGIYRMRFSCDKPKSEGEGEYTLTGANAYSMTMTVTSAGQAPLKISGSGKLLDADCGDVKPLISR